MSGYFRTNIENMHGYIPGEQPKVKSLVKLNTNENPYAPTPNIEKKIKTLNCDRLRLYPDPLATDLRKELAKNYNLEKENLIIGNGSDDILTIATRSFVGENDRAACFCPSYSLYPILTDIQSSKIIQVPLNSNDFSPSEDLIDPRSDLFTFIKKTKIFFIARPNAPTGTNIDLEFLESFCELYPGIVFIDEAYADFSEDNSLELLNKFSNVIISRTLSKSYSLAGLRVGWAISSEEIISGMMKVKDSYNIGTLPQLTAIEAIKDTHYLSFTLKKILTTRKRLTKKLIELGFKVIPSQANFVFASPPSGNAEELFTYLRANNILVRYFPGNITGKFIRVTIGKDGDIDLLLKICNNFINQHE